MNTTPENPFPPVSTLVKTPEDVLAWANHTLEFEPVNSCILISIRADDSFGAALRCDLPDPTHYQLHPDDSRAEYRSIAWKIGPHLRQDPGAQETLIILKNDRPVPAGDIADALEACRRLAADIAESLREHQMPARASWVIMNEQIWHLHCTCGPDECPVQGKTFGDPNLSFVDAVFRIHGSALQPGPRDRANPLAGRQLHPQIVTDPSRDPSADPTKAFETPEALAAWIENWDRLLDGESIEDLHRPDQLLRPLRYRSYRDVIISLACFGKHRTLSGMVGLEIIDRTTARALEVTERAENTELIAGCLVGESSLGPNWNRVARLENLATRLIPVADDDAVVVLMTILIWIEWSRGRASFAAARYDQLEKAGGGGYKLAEMLQRALQLGMVCQWARDENRAWSSSTRPGAA